MAKLPVLFFFFVFFLAVTDLRSARSARLLDETEVDSQPQVVGSPALATNPSFSPATFPAPQVVPGAAPAGGQVPATFPAPQVGPGAAPSGGQVPATFPAPQVGPGAAPSGGQITPTTPVPTTSDDEADSPVSGTTVPGATTTPVSGSPADDGEDDDDATTPVAVAPVAGTPSTASPTGLIPSTVVGATATPQGPQTTAQLSFFMHDILGGSNPSARIVTGIIANSGSNGIAFSKPYDNFFPIQGAVPLLNNDNLHNIINNNNNIPFLAGLNGAAQGGSLVLQNSANNGVVNGAGNQPFVTAGQLPSRAVLQQLMFGSVTVIDDELTEGHELGSAVIGKAQGFYLASSLDGTSQTVALTALFHGGGSHEHEVYDTISFFGVHRTASPESEIAVIGGTGKYENAKGYATVETLHHQEDQHTTDGVDTIVHFSVYLTEE